MRIGFLQPGSYSMQQITTNLVFSPEIRGDPPSQGKQEKGSHLGGGHVTKEPLGEIDVGVAQMWVYLPGVITGG